MAVRPGGYFCLTSNSTPIISTTEARLDTRHDRVAVVLLHHRYKRHRPCVVDREVSLEHATRGVFVELRLGVLRLIPVVEPVDEQAVVRVLLDVYTHMHYTRQADAPIE